MSNIFTRYLGFTDPPWRVQDPNRGIIVDSQDRRIATVAKPGAVPFDERQHNLALISRAPEIYAALVEAAYKLNQSGTPLSAEYYDLINSCRGVDQQLFPNPPKPMLKPGE